jgi:sialate O-acetylesterase
MFHTAVARLACALALGIALASVPSASFAVITLTTEPGNQPDLFASGMVLQRDAVVPVWGKAAVGATIDADFVDPSAAPGSEIVQSRSTTANASGRWVVRFDNLPVGGPYELRLYENGEASPSVTLVDVLVGDVWLLSGQSNMVLRGPLPGDAEAYPDVRAITIKSWGQKPSGAAFYFGAQLYDQLHIPIGLLNRAKADTALNHWLPSEIVDDEDPVVPTLFTGCGGGTPIINCLYYDQFIRPLERPLAAGEDPEGVALRGIVWWQGEKGEDKRGTDAYTHLFPAMIRTWRKNLGQPNLPFVFHQLPSGTGLRWTDLRVKSVPSHVDLRHWQPKQRIAFFRTLAVPATSLMSSIDLPSGTHPQPFEAFGRRLGDAALGTAYVASGDVALFPYSGAIYESAALEPAVGADEVRIKFRAGTADGLKIGPSTAPPGTPLQGFAVCCNLEGEFVFADARIENDNEVVVSHPDVATPTAVHYSIGRNARWANLFNGIEHGTAPFSTELAPFPAQDPDADGFWEPGPYDDTP